MIEKGKFNGKLLFHRRLELGLTIEALCKSSALNRGSICKWQAGQNNPTPKSLLRLSRALKVKPTYFYQKSI